MSKCGCSGNCTCYVVGGDSVNVAGNGSTSTPYLPQVNFLKEGSTACLRFMRDCLPQLLGDGLMWKPDTPDDPSKFGTLAVRVSNTANNLVHIGTDGGVFAGAQGTPGLSCIRDVTTTAAGSVWGRGGIGWNVSPGHLIRSIRMAQAAGVDGVMLNVSTLADGSLTVVPYGNSFIDRWTWPACHLTPEDSNCGGWYTYLPYPNYLDDRIGLTQFKNLDVATEDFYDQSVPNQWGANTVTEIMDEIGGTMKIAWNLLDFTYANRAAMKSRMVQTIARHIKNRCLQKSQIILANRTSDIAPLNGQGFQTGVLLESDSEVTTNPAAGVVAAGGTWAFLSWQIRTSSAATYTSYRAAGLKTTALYVTRKDQVTAALGAPYNFLAVMSEDTPYTMGKGVGLVQDPWIFGAMTEGQLGESIDYGQYRTRLRGFPYLGGWCMPPLGSTGNAETLRQLTLGWATPFPLAAIAAGQHLTVTWDQMWEPSAPIPPWDTCLPDPSPPPWPPSGGVSGGPKLGICLMLDTDQPASDVRTSLVPARAFDPPSYYWCYQTVDGALNVEGRLNNAAVTAPVSTPTGAAAAPTQGTWQTFRVIVRPADLTIQRLVGGASVQAVTFNHTAAEEAALRTNLPGRYLAIRKQKNTGAVPFNGLFRNVSISVTNL